jgi:hypothetical protein
VSAIVSQLRIWKPVSQEYLNHETRKQEIRKAGKQELRKGISEIEAKAARVASEFQNRKYRTGLEPDHSRRNREQREAAINFLRSCFPNSILLAS